MKKCSSTFHIVFQIRFLALVTYESVSCFVGCGYFICTQIFLYIPAVKQSSLPLNMEPHIISITQVGGRELKFYFTMFPQDILIYPFVIVCNSPVVASLNFKVREDFYLGSFTVYCNTITFLAKDLKRNLFFSTSKFPSTSNIFSVQIHREATPRLAFPQALCSPLTFVCIFSLSNLPTLCDILLKSRNQCRLLLE